VSYLLNSPELYTKKYCSQYSFKMNNLNLRNAFTSANIAPDAGWHFIVEFAGYDFRKPVIGCNHKHIQVKTVQFVTVVFNNLFKGVPASAAAQM